MSTKEVSASGLHRFAQGLVPGVDRGGIRVTGGPLALVMATYGNDTLC